MLLVTNNETPHDNITKSVKSCHCFLLKKMYNKNTKKAKMACIIKGNDWLDKIA